MEVMIAITILSFVSFSTYKLVDTNTETKTRVVKEDRQTVQTITALGRIDSDISQIYNPLYAYGKQLPQASSNNDIYADPPNANGAFDGKTSNGGLIPQIKSEDKSSLIFFTQANRRKVADSKESRFAWVKYSLRNMEPDPDAEPEEKKTAGLYELVRQTIATDVYNNTLDWEKSKPQVVMDSIKSLEFSFWDERAKKYTTSIQELNENKNLIRSIKVDITWIDGDNHEQIVMKTMRVLNPYFNTKLDALKTNQGLGAGMGGEADGGMGGAGVPQF